jgi:Ca2+-dependent lipid-binding protein
VAATLRENLLTANLFYNLSSAAISFSQALQQTALFLYVFLLNTPHPAFRFANFATQVPTACLSTQTITRQLQKSDPASSSQIRPVDKAQ